MPSSEAPCDVVTIHLKVKGRTTIQQHLYTPHDQANQDHGPQNSFMIPRRKCNPTARDPVNNGKTKSQMYSWVNLGKNTHSNNIAMNVPGAPSTNHDQPKLKSRFTESYFTESGSFFSSCSFRYGQFLHRELQQYPRSKRNSRVRTMRSPSQT
jgi:hypothetical protein